MPRTARWVLFALMLSLAGFSPPVAVFAQEDQTALDTAMDAPAADDAAPAADDAAPAGAMPAPEDAPPAADAAGGAPAMVTSDGENIRICVRVIRSSDGTVTTEACLPDK